MPDGLLMMQLENWKVKRCKKGCKIKNAVENKLNVVYLLIILFQSAIGPEKYEIK